MDSTHVAIGLSKMDFSAVCHLTLMTRSFLQKKNKNKTKPNKPKQLQNLTNKNQTNKPPPCKTPKTKRLQKQTNELQYTASLYT